MGGQEGCGRIRGILSHSSTDTQSVVKSSFSSSSVVAATHTEFVAIKLRPPPPPPQTLQFAQHLSKFRSLYNIAVPVTRAPTKHPGLFHH